MMKIFYWLKFAWLFILIPQNELGFKTVHLKNREYVKIPISSGLPLDATDGEDITSKRYGFPKMVATSDIPDNYMTVGLNQLEIVADLDNNLKQDLKVDRIQLLIVKRHTSTVPSSNYGSWNIPVANNFLESIEFEIDDELEEIVVIPEKLLLKKADVETDRRIRFAVSTLENKINAGTVIEFEIKVEASSIGVNSRKVSIASDKRYFLATK